MRRALCAAVLCFEAVVLGLTTPVLISVRDVETATALWIGLGLMVLCILTAGLLRKEWAFWLGWMIQLAAIALGFEITVMFVLGLIFFLLWLAAYLLGGRIDADRTAMARSVQAPAEPVAAPAHWDHELVCDEQTHRPYARAALVDLRSPRNMAMAGFAALAGIGLLFSDNARPVGVLLLAAAVVFPLVGFVAQRQAWRSFLAPGRTFRSTFGEDRMVLEGDGNLLSVPYDEIAALSSERGLVSVELADGRAVQVPEAVFPESRVQQLAPRH